MRPLFLIAVLGAVHPLATAEAGDLTLRRLMLSSAGVGYYEYEAAVDGSAPLGLDVRLEQVDDVLKSLVMFDAAGRVGAVTLPSRGEQDAALGDVPFGRTGLGSARALLEGLRGVAVQVKGPRPMEGRVLSVEVERQPGPTRDQPGPERTRVSLITETGLQQFVLEDSDSVQVTDPDLRERINRALQSLRGQGARDNRHLTLTTGGGDGGGPRTVRVAFVAGAPLWKASYRLVLPPPDADPATATARLQGWATLENATGSDWAGISLQLQYGNPVTFRQAIYRSYYVERPEVPVEVLGRLLPDVDTRARSLAMARRTAPTAPPVAMAPAPPPPAPAPAGEPSADLAVAGADDPATVAEGATETVFTLPRPLDLPNGHSASVPILDVSIPAAPVALAKPGDAHPLAAIRLSNNSSSSLPAGVLTLYDGSGTPYAGDARLGGLPAGESRLVAYAQDLRTALSWRMEDAATLASLSASGGVLTVDRRNRQVTHVTLTAPAAAPRRVLLDVPKPADGSLAEGFARATEETAASWRIAADLRPGETRELTYAVDQHEKQSVTLLDDDGDAVAAVLNLQGASPAARAALGRVASLRRDEAARTAERDRLVAQRDATDADQTRLRANLAALQPTDALRTRLLRLLDADETKRAQLDAAADAADAAVAKAHAAVVEAITTLRF